MAANDLAGLEAFFSGTTIASAKPETGPLHSNTSQQALGHDLWNPWDIGASGSSVVKQAPVEDDDFGDFESGTAAPTEERRLQAASKVQHRQDQPLSHPNGSPGGHAADHHVDRDSFRASPRSAPKPQRTDDVLFDIDDEADEDGFGDFEDAAPAPKRELSVRLAPIEQPRQIVNAPSKRSVPNLLDLDDFEEAQDAWSSAWSVPVSPLPQDLPASDDISTHNVVSQKPDVERPPRLSNRAEPAAAPLPSTSTDNDDWEDFEAAPTDTDQSVNSAVGSPSIVLPILLKTRTVDNQPPSNIPPPVIILSAFRKILELVRTALLDPLSRIPHLDPHREVIMAHESTRSFFITLLQIVTALGHVVAGRKLRWKRDTILAQSMRIGQASSRNSGMKLTTLDKGENAKEDREAQDTIAFWRSLVGRIKTTATALGLASQVPELAENMPVRAAVQNEGALTALKPCLICGIKRNERVNKVDVNVDDSFGEWWIEHWGHKTCAQFWISHRDQLKDR